MTLQLIMVDVYLTALQLGKDPSLFKTGLWILHIHNSAWLITAELSVRNPAVAIYGQCTRHDILTQ